MLRLQGGCGGVCSPLEWRPPTQPLARRKLPPKRWCPSPEEERRPQGGRHTCTRAPAPACPALPPSGKQKGADGGRSSGTGTAPRAKERKAWRRGLLHSASSVRRRHAAAPRPSLRRSPGEASGEHAGLLLMIRDHLLTLSIRIIKGCIFCGKIQHKEHASLNMEIQNFISNLLDLN